MKSMNRKEGKKIAVIAAIVMGFMVFAFMPAASAGVTSFTVTPGTGLAGAVDSYNALVTTTGVNTLNISIPAGFRAVKPMTGGVEIARVEFWNTSTRDYYGYGTVTANNAKPQAKVDVYCKMQVGGDVVEYGPTAQNVNYNTGGFTTLVVVWPPVGAPIGTATVNITIPTEEDNGGINITIDCFSLDLLEDVHIAIKQFVKNPATADDYVFSTDDGKTATVPIRASGGCGIVFNNGRWYVDTNGDHVANYVFMYGMAGSIPLIGDFGSEDTAVVKAYGGNYKWFVDTNGDHVADDEFWFGFDGATPLVGDIDQNGTDDIAIVAAYGGNYRWFVDTDGDHVVDLQFWYGFEGAKPRVGDIDQDGIDDIAIVATYGGNYRWLVDTDGDHMADEQFWYGFDGATPLVGDIDRDGTDDIAIVNAYGGNYKWFVDTDGNHAADEVFWYGFAGSTPLAGNIG